MADPASALRGRLRAALIFGALLGLSLAVPVEAAVKDCPIDKAQLEGGLPCPQAGGELRAVEPGTPQSFAFCSICRYCWTGVAVEAGKEYRLRILGEPERWADAGWKPATAAEALKGWKTLSDIPGTPWWERVVYGPFIRMAKDSRAVPDADWFQVFFAVRDAGGSGSDPLRLEKTEQVFTAARDGELYFFVNDHPDYYVKNNSGRMTLEISRAGE